jgi:heme-degrading monooxygenase HmoA
MGISGLAASIRDATESETFDLGGQNVTTISSTIHDAFREPFVVEGEEHAKMIRLTFITGAGKQGRQKYDEGAARAVTSVLNTYGYQEDRGASCVMECAGCYKLQHDTGKNLKTVVVFPKIQVNKTKQNSLEIEPLLPLDSPGYKLAVCSMPVFTNMVKAKCPSWSQKKGCLECIEGLRELLRSLDEQLMNGTPLNDSEQAFYDSVVLLDDKDAHVRQELLHQVETGNVTSYELEILVEHNARNLSLVTKEKKSTAKALQRKNLLQSIEPMLPHGLKYEADIAKLRKERVPLVALEKEARGRLLTLKETQTLARKVEIDDEIEYLEHASRGWFEEDAFFESRLQASRTKFETKQKKKALKMISIGTDTKVKVNTKWLTPQEQKAWAKKEAEKKRKKQKGGSAFSSMVMDTSSEEEDDDNDDDDESSDGEDVESENALVEGAAATAGAKRKRKKKKKSFRQLESEEAASEKATSIVRQTIFILQNFILPQLLAFFLWLVSLIFGKPKKNKRS